MASWNYDPIVYKKRKGSIDDPFIEYDNVPYIVKNSRVLLQEIPSEKHRVFITGLTETLSKIPESGKFYVDYNNGFIYLNEDINNTTVSISFFGSGIAFFPASRIYVLSDGDDIIQTLQDLLDGGKLTMNRIRETYIDSVAHTTGTNVQTFYAQPGYIAKLKYIGINIPAIDTSIGNHKVDVTLGTEVTFEEEKLFTRTVSGTEEISIKSEIDSGIYDIIFDENIPIQVKYTNNTDTIQTGTRFIYLIYEEQSVI